MLLLRRSRRAACRTGGRVRRFPRTWHPCLSRAARRSWELHCNLMKPEVGWLPHLDPLVLGGVGAWGGWAVSMGCALETWAARPWEWMALGARSGTRECCSVQLFAAGALHLPNLDRQMLQRLCPMQMARLPARAYSALFMRVSHHTSNSSFPTMTGVRLLIIWHPTMCAGTSAYLTARRYVGVLFPRFFCQVKCSICFPTSWAVSMSLPLP